MIPKGWDIKRIDGILRRVSQPINPISNELYQEIGIRSHGKGIFHKPLVSGYSLGNKRVFRVVPDSLVFNIVFAWEQAVAITSDNEKGMIASHRFPQYKPIGKNCDLTYLLYFFKTEQGKELLASASPGGAGRNKTLGQSSFGKLKLLLPPIEEQIKIAEILSVWDKAIETIEKLIKIAETEKIVLMNSLMKGKSRFPKFSKAWSQTTLGKLSTMRSGGTPNTTIESYFGGDIPWVSIKDMTQSGKFVSATEKTLTKQGLQNSSAFLFPPKTVLFAMYASLGECSIATRQLTTSQAILGIQCSEELLPEYLYHFLGFQKEKIKLTGQHGTQANLNAGMVRDLTIHFPEIKEQLKVADCLDVFDSETSNLKRYRNSLVREKSALMQQLLTGKRRVKVSDAVLELVAK